MRLDLSMLTSDPAGPMSSAEIPLADADRVLEVEEKHRLVSEFLAAHDFDALLLQEPANFAWFTSGGDCTRGGLGERTAALFVTPQARLLVCGNADTARLFDQELPGLGFQLKERPWYESRQVLIGDLCRGRNVASDTGIGETSDVSVHLAGMRLPLTARECDGMRELGKLVVHSLEATGRSVRRGQTEAEIAGELCHRLIRHGVTPLRIQVWADDSGRRHRHWSYGDATVERSCALSVVGRQNGLSVGASRTVCFGEPTPEFLSFYQRALLVQATGMFFSKIDWELYETWSRVQRIYEKYEVSEEWRLADQAEVIGYELCEAPVVPRSAFRLSAGTPVHWHASVGPCLMGDTILVGSPRTRGQKGFEVLTPVGNWPTAKIDVKGKTVTCPGLLLRDAEKTS